MTEHLSKSQHQSGEPASFEEFMKWNGNEEVHTHLSRSHARGTATAVDLVRHYQSKRWMLNIPRWCKDWGCMYSSQHCYGVCDCALLLISQLPWERNCIPLACEIECNSEVTARYCNRKNHGRFL